jgi:hypothetical protein
MFAIKPPKGGSTYLRPNKRSEIRKEWKKEVMKNYIKVINQA